jgi:hypothetical protein
MYRILDNKNFSVVANCRDVITSPAFKGILVHGQKEWCERGGNVTTFVKPGSYIGFVHARFVCKSGLVMVARFVVNIIVELVRLQNEGGSITSEVVY